MGEVWRARDPRLGRDVAIKISAHQFTDRFEREARAIAALNHPNICTLFDVGPNYLVMELVEGPTLAERIRQGPIPLDEALGIAKQIGDALEAAHDKAIVHRDLKPANVKIRPDGSVKVLDFGLAKAGAETELSSDSPTLLSVSGMILGTAGYMSPEQARGQVVDKRADIWAFGVVLYEMLTAKRLFDGATITDSLAAILTKEPDLSLVPEKTRRLLRRCLEKDPRKRLRGIADWQELLVEPVQTAPSRSRFGKAGWIAAAVLALSTAAVSLAWFRQPPHAHVVTRFQFQLPEGQAFTRTGRHVLAISPDGTKLAYVANYQLYLRAMDQLEAQPVRGTNEDPMEPVFSPDGQWLAYFVPTAGTPAGGGAVAWTLKKIAVAGGAPVTLAKLASAPYGVTWRNGTIAFALNEASIAGIQAVPDSGGVPQTIVTIDPKKERVAQPQLLADGKHLLFVSLPKGFQGIEGQLVVQAIQGKGGENRRTLINNGTDPRVLPAGQLAYIHDGTLLAVPFDGNRLAVTGGPVPIVEGITENQTTWAGQFGVSPGGTLAYTPGVPGGTLRTLEWVDRQGHEQPISGKPRVYNSPRLSPDGTRIAVSADDEEHDIWVFDVAKETLTRLTFGPAYETQVAWTPDSNNLFFSSGPSAPGQRVKRDIFRKSVNGTGTIEALTQHLEGGSPLTLSPDGKSLVYRKAFENNSRLFVLPLEPTGQGRALIADPKFNEFDVNNAEISPDGRWIAYDSSESGRIEIYVRPFPAVDSGRWQVSPEGGTRPLWSRSGRELFFLSATNRMTAVPVAAGPGFAYGKPQPLFDASAYDSGPVSRNFDISADGTRFLMVKDVRSSAAPRQSIIVVSHWFDEVKAKMPAQR